MDELTWTVKRVLEWIEGYLSKRGDENPRISAQWLVSEALGVSRMQLFVDAERPLTEDERAVLRDWTRRRGAGEPLQYITGEVGFRHITVKVAPGVLIPRPETEVLVSEALALLPPAPKPQDDLDGQIIKMFVELGGELPGSESEEPMGDSNEKSKELLVADICTGSGCIACSIAYEHPLTKVVATDISTEALELASINVNDLGLGERVELLECDLGNAVDAALMGTFDLVVSNPPYIPTSVLQEVSSEVSEYEPLLALDGGQDGLAVFRRLLEWTTRALAPGGAVAFELHETCLEAASEEARAAGFEEVRIVYDLSERPRVLVGRKSGPHF